MIQSTDGAWRYVKLMLELDDPAAARPKRVNLAADVSSHSDDGVVADDLSGGDTAKAKPSKARSGSSSNKSRKKKKKNKKSKKKR